MQTKLCVVNEDRMFLSLLPFQEKDIDLIVICTKMGKCINVEANDEARMSRIIITGCGINCDDENKISITRIRGLKKINLRRCSVQQGEIQNGDVLDVRL